MTGWTTVLAACGLCYALKLAGYLAPARWLARPRVARLAAMMTVALLTALCAVQAVSAGRELRLDARAPAVTVAALLLWRRAPFVVVVVAGAVTAAGLRAAGWR